MREILPDRLFLGNALEARDLRLLYDNQISAVVDIAVEELPAQLARDLVYCRIPINDGAGNTQRQIETAIRCVVTLVQQDFRTLIACSAGMSRSPAVAAAALAFLENRTPDECLSRIILGAPHDVSPSLWSSVKTIYEQMNRS